MPQDRAWRKAITLAGSASALHAPEAARRYPGMRAELVYRRDPVANAAIDDRMAGALAWLRDEPHVLHDAVHRLIAASMSDEGRYRLMAAFRLTVHRDFPHAELAAGSRSGEEFLLRYTGGDDIASLASMPAYDPAAGTSYACILDSRLFAALGEAFEQDEKKAAVEPRPDRRERADRRQSPDADTTAGKNKTAGDSEQPPTEPLPVIGLVELDHSPCVGAASPSRRRAVA